MERPRPVEASRMTALQHFGPRTTRSWHRKSSHYGVLNNELYIGRYVWNRRECIRDPDDPK